MTQKDDFKPEPLSATVPVSTRIEKSRDNTAYIEGTPRHYGYSEKSILSLGQSYDPKDVTDYRVPCIEFEPLVRDQGSPSSSVRAVFIRNRTELELTMGLSGHAEARALGSGGRSEYSFSSVNKFSRDSVSVLLVATADYGRFSLKPGVSLTEDAAELLSRDHTEFAERHGTRYVAQERRGANLSVLITISGIDVSTKNTFTSSFSGSGGWGPVKGSAKTTFNLMLGIGSKQSRVSIEARAVGGDGISSLSDLLLQQAQSSSDPLGAMMSACAKTLKTFTKENAATIEYTTSTLEDFGWNPNQFPGWPDQKEIAIRGLASDYWNTLKDIEIVKDYEKRRGVYYALFPNILEYMVAGAYSERDVRPIVEAYQERLEAQHRQCLENPSLEACSRPDGRYTIQGNFINEQLQERAAPPTLELQVIVIRADGTPMELDHIKSAIVMRSEPSARMDVVKNLEPAADNYYTWFTYGGSLIRSYKWVTEWSDGTVREQPGSGFGSMSIVFDEGFSDQQEPRKGFERSKLDWLARHKGQWSVVSSLKLIDGANREFNATYMEADWSANGNQITSGEVRFLSGNALVHHKF